MKITSNLNNKIISNRLRAISLVEVRHIRQDAHQVAHLLVKVALLYSLDLVWVGECTSSIQNIVLVQQVFLS
jgi:hypothetical protein